MIKMEHKTPERSQYSCPYARGDFQQESIAELLCHCSDEAAWAQMLSERVCLQCAITWSSGWVVGLQLTFDESTEPIMQLVRPAPRIFYFFRRLFPKSCQYDFGIIACRSVVVGIGVETSPELTQITSDKEE